MQVTERFAFESTFGNTLDGTVAHASGVSASNHQLSLPEKKRKSENLQYVAI